MRLTITTFITLDGVMQAPGAPEEDRRGGFEHGGWVVPYVDDDMSEVMGGWFGRASAFLLGRKTYEMFAGHWPHVPDSNQIAAALNRNPKYVVSTTLSSLGWAGSTLIGGDVAGQVAELKERPGKELQVHGSGQLAQTLIAHGLVDEYRLLTYPVFLGAGRRLFADPGLAGALRLTSTQATAAGVIVATYEPAGQPRHGTFETSPEPSEHRILR